jgi:Protein of unknown function (DUF2911)
MLRTLFASLAVSLLLASPVSAQKASQTGTVSQEVNDTRISMQYDRPVARGRALFGELIEWDAIWTPGANRATWIDFSKPVTLEGHKLDAGRYGIWMTPKEDGNWGVTVVSEWDTHHGMFPFGEEVTEFTVQTGEASHIEVLAFYFPEVGPYATTLTMHWGTTTVPLRIEVGQ